MGRKLWLLTGGAFAFYISIGLATLRVPSFQPYLFLALSLLLGIWAALSVVVLLAEARPRTKLAVLAALAGAGILSWATHWFGFAAFLLAYFGAMLFLGALLVFAALRLFRRKPGLRILLPPLTMIVAGVGGILLSAWSSRPVPPLPQQALSTSDEIKYIYETDQSDRLNGRFVMNMDRDRVRLQRVKALYRSGKITDPLDQYRAGLVYQHAACADDYQIAYELAQAAAAHGVAGSQWLAHAAYDRWQMSLGKWQTYGTQLVPIPINRPCPVP